MRAAAPACRHAIVSAKVQENLRPSRSSSTEIERFTDSGEDRAGVPGGDQVSPVPVNDDRQAGQTKRKLASDIALIHRV